MIRASGKREPLQESFEFYKAVAEHYTLWKFDLTAKQSVDISKGEASIIRQSTTIKM